MATETGEKKEIVAGPRRLMYFPIAFAKGDAPTGKVFNKEIIREGTWTRPGMDDQNFVVTKERMQQWVNNFDANLMPEGIMITLGHDTWDPMAACGMVTKMWVQDAGDGSPCKLMGEFTFMLDEVAARINSTIRGVSMGLDMDYTDPQSGAHCGETIYHVALTNDPHIKGMDPFIEAAIDRTGKKEKIEALVFQNGTGYKKQDAGGKEAEFMAASDEKIVELERKLGEATAKISEVSTKYAESVEKNIQLGRQTEDLSARQHETELKFRRADYSAKVEALVAEGKILPAERASVLELVLGGIEMETDVLVDGKPVKQSVADRTIATFAKMAPKVKVGAAQLGHSSTTQAARGEGPSVDDLTKWKYQMFFGQISVAEFKKRRDAWADSFAKAGAYVGNDREMFIKDSGARDREMFKRIGFTVDHDGDE